MKKSTFVAQKIIELIMAAAVAATIVISIKAKLEDEPEKKEG